MKKLGFILELNPPHNGHAYFIDKATKEINPDYTIACMSTSFCMRGTTSCVDKFQKAKIALKLGIDYVFELPTSFYLQSADYFCSHAIKILAKLEITDIAFGVELDNLEKLQKIVDIQSTEAFNIDVKAYMAKGSSYSSACLKALLNHTDDKEIIDNFSLPNNTLAIGYLKALREYPNINIHLIKRIDNNYYDEELSTSSISSATAIRKAIDNDQEFLDAVIDKDYNYSKVSETNSTLLKLLKYQFIVKPLSDFTSYIGVSEGIESRILKVLPLTNDYDELVKTVQTRRYSLNHVNRIIVNIVLENKLVSEETYLRLLAFKKGKKAYLNSLNKDAKALIFSSPIDNESIILANELKASRVYDILTGKSTAYEEYKVPLVLDEE